MRTVWRKQREALFLDPVSSSKLKEKHSLYVHVHPRCVFWKHNCGHRIFKDNWLKRSRMKGCIQHQRAIRFSRMLNKDRLLRGLTGTKASVQRRMRNITANLLWMSTLLLGVAPFKGLWDHWNVDVYPDLIIYSTFVFKFKSIYIDQYLAESIRGGVVVIVAMVTGSKPKFVCLF